MIGNLTAIQTLDLSYNEINDLSEPDIFEPPTNLTNLYLSHNRLTHLPFNKILPLPNLKILDLESNSIGVFDETFMKIINNGTKVRYHGKTSYFCSKEKYIFPKKKKKKKRIIIVRISLRKFVALRLPREAIEEVAGHQNGNTGGMVER